MASAPRSQKVLWAAAFLTLLASSAVGAQQEQEGIYWYNDLKEAVKAAEQSNLPMMIDFWADWCGPCKIMDAEVYPDPAVIAAFKGKMIGVRIHFDMQQELARKYNVPGLPYLSFANSYGTELMHHRGLLEKDDLIAVVKAFPADVSEINRLDRALRQDKNHFPSLRDMGLKLREFGFYDASNRFLDRAFKHRDSKKNLAERETILYSMAQNWLQLRDGKSAAARLEQCLQEFPQSPRKPDFLLGLGRAYALDKKPSRARKSLERLIAEFPGSPAAAQARDLLRSP